MDERMTIKERRSAAADELEHEAARHDGCDDERATALRDQADALRHLPPPSTEEERAAIEEQRECCVCGGRLRGAHATRCPLRPKLDHPDADLVALAEELETDAEGSAVQMEAAGSEARANVCAGRAMACRHYAYRLRAIIAEREADRGE